MSYNPNRNMSTSKIHIFPPRPFCSCVPLDPWTLFPSSWFCFMCCGKSLKKPLRFLSVGIQCCCRLWEQEWGDESGLQMTNDFFCPHWMIQAFSCLHASVLFRCGKLLWSLFINVVSWCFFSFILKFSGLNRWESRSPVAVSNYRSMNMIF